MKKPVIDNKELMQDWDWDKNNAKGLDPSRLSCGSNKTAHWKCHVCGNEWTTRIERKYHGHKCKQCIAKELSTAEEEKSLKALFPKVAEEWDYELNDTTPDKVYPQSNKKYHWICSKGHRWEDSASHRTMRGNMCPYCSNHRTLEGFNDIATTHPYLLKEWDWEKNNELGILPSSVTYGSTTEVYWKCSRGHSWKTQVYVRTSNNDGCPQCSKETRTSYSEKAIAFYMSLAFDDMVENYRCKQLNKLELDIFIPSLNVGIEYDGAMWHKSSEKDKSKDDLCEKLGIMLYRIRENGCPNYQSMSKKYYITYNNNQELENAITEILKDISEQYNLCKSIDINIERDNPQIIARTLTIVKDKSIANSSLIDEWDYEKNKGINPEMIALYSNRKFWWKCKLGHSWQAGANKRAIGRNCPYCAGQKTLKGFNDLESQFPNIAKEWDNTKNKKKPDEVSAKSNKKYWWICSKCGYSWETRISIRTLLGCGCPKCKQKIIARKLARKVIDLDTNIVYESANQASRETGIPQGSISCCCNEKTKTAGKHHWKYID